MAFAAKDALKYSTNLRERMSSLLQAGRWTDCKFLVGIELQELNGHKIILAQASPVFEAMFFGEMAESKNPILIPDIQPATFKAILTYIYTDDFKIRSLDEAINLYYAGNKYILPNLEKICLTYIESNLISKNVCRAYEFASLFQEDTLKKRCLELMKTQTDYIFNDTSFKDIQLSTLATIFSIDSVNCTALGMFNALEKYVKLQDPCGDIEPILNLWPESPSQSSNSQSKCLNQEKEQLPESKGKPEIRAALAKIPFLNLTAKEFAEGPAKSGLLTESDTFAIIMNIASDKTNIPMPSGFNTKRRKEDHYSAYNGYGRRY